MSGGADIFSILRESAARWRDRTAIVHNARAFTFAELHSAAEAASRQLDSAGIRTGDKVGLLCAEGPEYIAAFFAICHLGAVVVPISPAYKPGEIKNLASEIGLDAFCCSAKLAERAPGAGATVAVPLFGDRSSLSLRRLEPTAADERARLLGVHAASIRFSSGTTGKAKGIVLSHETIFERASAKCEAIPLSDSDSVLYLFSTGRSVPTRLLVSIRGGAKIVLADALRAPEIESSVREHAVTQIFAPPFVYQALLHEPEMDARSWQRVEYFFSTASALPPQAAENFRARFGREIVQYYSSGEVGSPFVNFRGDISKRGSVGTVVGGYQVKLAPPDSEPEGDGAFGEICVRGPGMFDAYYKPWRPRAEVLADGWFHTGDLARRDADGYYWIVGRVKDAINVGGVKVFPAELEALLLGHPAVEDAVVFDAPEARFGEVPHARVKLRAGAAGDARELMRYVNERVSVFKALRAIQFVDELPKTVTGKVKRGA
ncbi:MAG TPA: class I adenylate-forming enzyme family protein [Candidatus Acidoferrales bacterium]|nr:class I adenylate-forming enzyme family protein [Candidatus Acidoferrales bacterium]